MVKYLIPTYNCNCKFLIAYKVKKNDNVNYSITVETTDKR